MARFTDRLKKTAEDGEGEFEVHLTAKAEASGTIKVMAKNAAEAQTLAKEKSGEVMWEYGGIEDGSVQTDIPGHKPEEMGMEMDMDPMADPLEEMEADPMAEDPAAEPMAEAEPAPDMAMGSRFARKLKNRIKKGESNCLQG